jgi:hypothetical protein
MKIEKAGIFRGVSSADYFSDPCPEPSFTQSLCKIIIEQSPRHAWTASSRLNPNWLPDDPTKFDLGNVAHNLILGRGKDYVVLDFADWRTKAAQDARKEAHAAGKVAILDEQFGRALLMNDAAHEQLSNHEDSDALTNGSAETMICWQEDGIWFRSLVDWLHDDLRAISDFKSTGMSVAPHVLGLRAQAGGWEIQAAFISRGLDILDPEGAGRRKFRFIAQETSEPYALNVMHMDETWLTMGRKKIEIGIQIWRNCIKTGKWTGYPARSIIPEYPGFKMSQWLEREEQEFSGIDSLMGG